LNNDEDDVATLDFLRRILPFVDHNKRNQTEKKNKERTRKGTKINQKSSTIFTSTN
jgi:hypothetical protein